MRRLHQEVSFDPERALWKELWWGQLRNLHVSRMSGNNREKGFPSGKVGKSGPILPTESPSWGFVIVSLSLSRSVLVHADTGLQWSERQLGKRCSRVPLGVKWACSKSSQALLMSKGTSYWTPEMHFLPSNGQPHWCGDIQRWRLVMSSVVKTSYLVSGGD